MEHVVSSSFILSKTDPHGDRTQRQRWYLQANDKKMFINESPAHRDAYLSPCGLLMYFNARKDARSSCHATPLSTTTTTSNFNVTITWLDHGTMLNHGDKKLLSPAQPPRSRNYVTSSLSAEKTHWSAANPQVYLLKLFDLSLSSECCPILHVMIPRGLWT